MLPPPPPPEITPSVTISVTQPQPAPGTPPFALLPCGRRMLIRGEKSRIELRDVASGEVITVWKWRLHRVQAVGVSGDGLTAAAGGLDGQIMLWDLE
jgi:hypothetical protein